MALRDSLTRSLPRADILSEDGRLVRQLRQGDREAGYRFVQAHYPAVYRYLLYLSGRPEMAEDLTQETFLQAWRHLDTFDETASLRPWLHRIAHREFLQALRARRSETALEATAEPPDPRAGALRDAVELRAVLDKLPAGEREAVVLHYLEGYSYSEIAAITGAPVGRITQQLYQARVRLRCELGERDLEYLNEPSIPMSRWAWLPLDQMYALERWLTREENMERREFLRQAAVGAAGLMLPEAEKEIVDSRLTQKVTLALKATALSDVCEQLCAATSFHLAAGPSVADEKVTIFCEKMPLRDVMRQLSRSFGYTWLRTGQAFRPGTREAGDGVQAFGKDKTDLNARTPERPNADYRYELIQDLRSQLLEEELRNRDRNAALLALEQEIERYRPFLELSPDEALARSETAGPVDKQILKSLGESGWGPAQMYFKLSRADLEALRAGQKLRFDSAPHAGEQPLPASATRGVLQSGRDIRYYKRGGLFHMTGAADAEAKVPDALSPAATPEAGAGVHLQLVQSELGEFELVGESSYYAGTQPPHRDVTNTRAIPLAAGRSPAVLKPENGSTNARLARDPALRASITVQPKPSCHLAAVDAATSGAAPEPRVASADVLEEIHRATGMPIVSDYYTRLYKPETVSVHGKPIFDALNSLADAMRLRWSKDPEGGWLQFRSASFFHDRLKEVPNRLLTRWSAARRQHGVLTLDDLLEIAQLPDAPLDAEEMAEGARALFGLAEWDVARSKVQRPHLRYLATFTPAQRQEALSPAGLPFTRMSLKQQQQYIAFALPGDAEGLQSLDELAGATLRVDYQQPGRYEWRPGSWYRWAMPTADGKRVPRLLLRERTREAALQAARRYFPPFASALVKAERAFNPGVTEEQLTPQAKEVVPTTLELQITYFPGSSHRHAIVASHPDGDDWRATWEELGK